MDHTSQLTVEGTLPVVPAASPPTTITRATLSGTNLVTSASGRVAYDPCYLPTSTNIAQPLANWIRLATNRFDATRNVNFTNAIVQGEPRRYFRLATD